MRLLVFTLIFCLSGCANSFEAKKERLEKEITILKLEVRKQKLENQLEILENE